MSRYHPKWREVDINASVAGWTRFAAASQWTKSAELSPDRPTRIGGPPLPMEGSTTSPVQLSAGSGDVERSSAEPVFNHLKNGLLDSQLSPSAANSKEAGLQGGHPVSFSSEQLDTLFREFLEYTKQESQREVWNENQALFAEFQTYVNHLLQQPNQQHTGTSAEASAAIVRDTNPGVPRH